jgi:hypothetical protein
MYDMRWIEVDWFDEHYVYPDGETGNYRSCDVCGESFIDDVDLQNGRGWDCIRRFYIDLDDRIIVCEHRKEA